MFSLLPVLLLAGLAAGTPHVGLPINAQVPPVARVAEPFSFTFAQSTFISDPASTFYTLAGNPAWLSLDGDGRRLWGTPGGNDVGAPVITLTASDGSGSAEMQATLIVDATPAPVPQGNFSDQLSRTGILTGPTTVTLHPSVAFEATFSFDTFSENGKNLTYYATSADRTPLPSWLMFFKDELRFVGTTPQLTAYPQRFDIMLIVSDFVGFAGAWVTFSLVINNHVLAFSPWREKLTITPGTALSLTDLRSHLLLDGNSVNDGDIQNAKAQGPDWLSFDPKSLAIIGMPPSGVKSQDVIITVTDHFSDQANATVRLQVGSDLFNGEIGTLNATAGMEFNYTISRSLFTETDLDVSMDLGDLGSWLTFDSNALNLHGLVPSTSPTQDHSATLTANVPGSSNTSSQVFMVYVEAAVNSHSSTTSVTSHVSSTVSSTSTPSATSFQGIGYDAEDKLSNKDRNIIIVLTVVVVLALVAFVVALVYCRRTRQGRKRHKALREKNISGPVELEAGQAQDLSDQEDEVEWGSAHSQLDDDDRPPQVDIAIPTRSRRESQERGRNSMASTLGERESQILAEFNRSYRPLSSMSIANELARRSRGEDQISRAGLLDPKRSSHPALRGSAPPRHRRITSINYGRYSLSSPSHGRSHGRGAGHWSMREPMDAISSSSYSTQSTGLLSATPSAFPAPPKPTRNPSSAAETAICRHAKRASADSGDDVAWKLPDRRPLDEKRQSYIRHRAARRSPFFAAGGPSSRASSLSRQRSHMMSGTSTMLSVPITATTDSSTAASKRNSLLRHTLSTKRKSLEPPDAVAGSESSQQPQQHHQRWTRSGIGPGFPRVVSNRLSRASSNGIYEDLDVETSTRPPSSLYSHVSDPSSPLPAPPNLLSHEGSRENFDSNSNWETVSHDLSSHSSSAFSSSAAPSIPPRSPARPQSAGTSLRRVKGRKELNRSRSAISIEKMKAAVARSGRANKEKREEAKRLKKGKRKVLGDVGGNGSPAMASGTWGKEMEASPLERARLEEEKYFGLFGGQDVVSGAERGVQLLDERAVSGSQGNEAFL